MFDFAFTCQTDVHGGDLSFAVNHESRGQSLHPAVELRDGVIADNDAVIDAELGHERLDHLPAFVIHGDADDFKAAVAELALKLLQPRNLDLAGPAPGGPEVEQDHLALVIREADRFAVSI